MARKPRRGKVATSKRRVYWLTEEFPPAVGGMGLAIASLAQGLAARGLETRVITRQIRPPTVWHETLGEVSVDRVRPAGSVKGAGWRAVPVMLCYLLRLLCLLVTHAKEHDVVIVSSMKTIPLAAVPVCRLLNKKCVIRIESPFELIEPVAAESLGAMNHSLGHAVTQLLSRLQRIALSRADCVIAISHEIDQLLVDLPLPPRRIATIPNPVDLAHFRPVPARERRPVRDRLGLPQNRTIALYAGRLTRAKGTAVLVEEWPRVLARHADLHLVLVGSGKESWDNCEEEINQIVRSCGLQRRITLAGQSTRVPEYMHAADFFVSPSEYEGFGMSVVEALACGLPVVVTTVGIAPEIIRHGSNGFLFPPKDRQGLVDAIDECVARRSRWADIGRRAHESAVRFDPKTVFDQYASLCAQLAPRHHRRRSRRR